MGSNTNSTGFGVVKPFKNVKGRKGREEMPREEMPNNLSIYKNFSIYPYKEKPSVQEEMILQCNICREEVKKFPFYPYLSDYNKFAFEHFLDRHLEGDDDFAA